MKTCKRNEEATVYVCDLDLFVTGQILEDTPAVLSFGKLCEDLGYSYEWASGQKTHLFSKKKAEQSNATRTTMHRSWSQDYRLVLPVRLQAHLLHRERRTPKTSRQVQQQYDVKVSAVHHWENSYEILQKPRDKNQNKDIDPVQGSLLHDWPEWLEDFSENLEDEGVASITGHTRQALLVNQSRNLQEKWYRGSTVFSTHFPKGPKLRSTQANQDYKVSLQEKHWLKAVPRAENFGDLIAADHKVLSKGCESRNNHRYAVVVQDLATQWIHLNQCQTETSQEKERSLRKFLEPSENPKVIDADNSLKFGKACVQDLSGNHCTSTPRRSETIGVVEKAGTQS